MVKVIIQGQPFVITDEDAQALAAKATEMQNRLPLATIGPGPGRKPSPIEVVGHEPTYFEADRNAIKLPLDAVYEGGVKEIAQRLGGNPQSIRNALSGDFPFKGHYLAPENKK